MPRLFDGPVPERRVHVPAPRVPVAGPHRYRLSFDDRPPVEVTADDAAQAIAARPAGSPMPHTMSDLTEVVSWFSHLRATREGA